MGSVAPTQQSVAESLAAHKFQEAEELQEELDYQEWWASELKEKLQYELELRDTHQVLIRLLALDRLLDSVPLQQQRKKQQQQQLQQNPDLDVILSIENSDPVLQEAAARYTTLTLDNRNLNRIANQVPRSDLIPATLVHICKTSWQGEIFKNVYCHSDMSKSRDPTCSEVLSLLRRFDRALGTRLRVKINAILRSGRCISLLFCLQHRANYLQSRPSGFSVCQSSFNCMLMSTYYLVSLISTSGT
jgi:hypothetical protein